MRKRQQSDRAKSRVRNSPKLKTKRIYNHENFKLSFTTYQIFNKVSEKNIQIKSILGGRGYKKLYKLKKYRTVRGC